MKITLILALVDNMLGSDNDLIIRDKEDMKHFKHTTRDQVCIMGRKTVESLPFKLTNRTVVCMSRNMSLNDDKADDMAHNIDDILIKYQDKDIFICGGNEIYRLFYPYADEMIVTRFNPDVVKDVSLGNVTYIDNEIYERIVLTEPYKREYIANGTICYYKLGE